MVTLMYAHKNWIPYVFGSGVWLRQKLSSAELSPVRTGLQLRTLGSKEFQSLAGPELN